MNRPIGLRHEVHVARAPHRSYSAPDNAIRALCEPSWAHADGRRRKPVDTTRLR